LLRISNLKKTTFRLSGLCDDFGEAGDSINEEGPERL
jgi:hypothetical protein